jgi:hypothetical protein
MIKLFILLLTSISAIYAAPVNLISNGSFEQNSGAWLADSSSGTCPTGYANDHITPSEQDLTSWTILPQSGSNIMAWQKCDTGHTPPDGTFMVYVKGAVNSVYLQQSFPTISGQSYVVKYPYYKRTNTSNSLYFNFATSCASPPNTPFHSDILTDTTATSPVNVPETHSFTFTAQSSSTCLSIDADTANQNWGYIFDNIQIYLKPLFDNNNNSVYPDDPTLQHYKAIPGQTMVFDIGLRNTGGETDDNTTGNRHFGLKIAVPAEISFELNSIVYQDGYQPVSGSSGDVTSNGNRTSITSSGMLCCGTTGDIEYSNVGISGPWTYTPTTSFSSGGKNYDNNVRAIKISPRGIFADGTSSATGFRIYYKGMIK